MIAFQKPADIPARLLTTNITELLEKHRRNVARDGKEKSSEFSKNVWLDDGLRETLWISQHKKCCYCEKQLELKRESDVEHYRPKSKVTPIADHPGYWWKAYSWDNYLYSCKHCNSDYKVNLFPLIHEENRVSDENEDLTLEQPVLINPFEDDPNEFLGYDRKDDLIFVVSRGDDVHKRGSRTSDICGLNRHELLVRRSTVWETLNLALTTYDFALMSNNDRALLMAVRTIRKLAAPESSHAGMVRYFVEQRGLDILENQ